MPSPWFLIRSPCAKPRVRLVCLPYAGGSAATYARWHTNLPADVEVAAVQLPGRTFRLREPSFTRMTPLVEALCSEIAALGDTPLALFGHSLGSLIAFEVARALEARGTRPVCVFASGRQPADTIIEGPHLHPMRDADFVTTLEERYGQSMLIHDPEVAALAMPSLRADFELFETYVFTPGARIQAPLVVFAGRKDLQTPLEKMHGWQALTSGAFEFHEFDGEHFFIDTARAAVTGRVGAILDRMLPR